MKYETLPGVSISTKGCRGFPGFSPLIGSFFSHASKSSNAFPLPLECLSGHSQYQLPCCFTLLQSQTMMRKKIVIVTREAVLRIESS
jgi:hypothetical protein